MSRQAFVSFGHGLGDCANFALQLPLYVRRGWDITIACDENKRALFELVGVKTVKSGNSASQIFQHHPWVDSNYAAPPHDNVLKNNKPRQNFLAAPLGPPSGEAVDALWQEYLSREGVDFSTHYADAAAYFANLPRPLFLLHSHGNTNPGSKNMPAAFALELATNLVRDTTGSVIFLDWDNRVPWFYSGRSRHLTQHLPDSLRTTAGLIGMLTTADLLIGVDSGPFHLAGLADVPSIGVWFGHHPAHFAIPRKNCLNIVCKQSPITLQAAHLLNTIDNDTADPGFVAAAAIRMTGGCRWLRSAAADTQLALLLKKCFGRGLNIAGTGDILGDRSISFGIAFDRLVAQQRPPVIVETGCIRADNDWAGAGYSTFILGLAAARLGGTLLSIDIDARNVQYAATACQNIPAVSVRAADSVTGLSEVTSEIDLLYLDSMDTYVAGHAEHGLKEAQVGVKKMSENGVIIFDDTLHIDGKFIGKGALAIPWLVRHNWRIIFSGYQVVLARAS